MRNLSTPVNSAYFMRVSLGGTLLLLLLPAFLVAFVDPYQLFHKPIARPDRFYNTDRYQNAGLINSWLNADDSPYEGIIIGTSMSQNFRGKTISDAQNVGAVLKLTLAGGRPRELAAVAVKALKNHNVKFVIWEFFKGYSHPDVQKLHPKYPLPLYLYEGSIIDSWPYLFNQENIDESIKLLPWQDRTTNKYSRPEDLYSWTREDSFVAWSTPSHQVELRNKVLATQPPLAVRLLTPMTDRYPNIDENLISIIRANPKVQFRLYFPPLSYISLLGGQPNKFERLIEIRRYLVQATTTLHNVSISSFDLIDGIGDTISVYKDSAHYRPWVNDFIAKHIHEPRHHLTVDNFSHYVQEFHTRLLKVRQDIIMHQ